MAQNSLDLHSLDSVPGTYSILADEETLLKTIRGANPNVTGHTEIKRSNNIILVPQPSESPNDPLNWGAFRKYWHMLLVCIVTGLTAATSNVAGSAQDGMNEELNISWDAMNTAAGVLFIGVGGFCFLLSPSSFLYGRKIAYLICILVGLGGALWFANVQTTQDSVWNQLFVGASEAAAEAQVQLSLSDIFFQHQQGFAISLYIMATSIGTYLGPLIAGYLADGPGWRWIAWLGAIVSGGLLIALIFGLEETYFDRDHYLKSQQVTVIEEKSEGVTTSMAAPEPPKGYWKSIAPVTLAVNLKGTGFKQYVQRLWLQCRVFLFPAVLYAGLQWGAQDIFLTFYMTTMSEDWISPPYNYSDSAVGLMNVPLLIGSIIGCIYGGYFSDKFVFYWASKYNHGVFEPEARLYMLLPTAIISPLGLIMFGVGTDKQWPWLATYFGLGFIGFGWGCAGDLGMSYLMDAYPEMVLEGMVGVSAVNNGLACIFTFACQSWIDHQGTLKTYIALGIISFLIFCTTVPMIIYGKACRRKTKGMYVEFLRRRDGM